ncbi:MAG TPA: hypothetical protein VM537_29110 [Anaerolineae bacterium]|nr:hypothetical protein [Anaerolineae bacterium]HUW13818.1 hypothetical protein [Anaerolineae bacterium]
MDRETIRACLEQIEWQRYRDGTYSNMDPYVAVKETLYRMRQDATVTLNRAEILLLYQATKESVDYIPTRPHMPETLANAVRLKNQLHEMAFRST